MASLMASKHMSVRHEDSQILDTPQAIGGFNGPDPLTPANWIAYARGTGMCILAGRFVHEFGDAALWQRVPGQSGPSRFQRERLRLREAL
jgi:hypothetical protein